MPLLGRPLEEGATSADVSFHRKYTPDVIDHG